MVIDLEVRRFLDLEALEHGIKLFSFRLWTRVQFQRPGGWTFVLPALIDTGAPFSVLPSTLWTAIESRGGFATTLRGVVPLQSAMLKASMAHITCIVSDLKTRSLPLKCWALLAEGDVPLVLGCAGVLDRVKLIVDAPHNVASLQL